MNIALLHYTCPPFVRGVEEIIRQQASLFHRFSHRVKIIVGNGSHFTDKYEIEINPLLSSKNRSILRFQQNVEKNLDKIEIFSNKIYQYLNKTLGNIDIVIAHNVLTMHYNLPLTMALHRLAEIKKIISWNHDSPYFYKNYDSSLDFPPWDVLKKYNDKIYYVTISNSRSKEFRKLYGIRENLPVIPNGIDPIRFFRLDRTTVKLIDENDLFSSDLIIVQPSRLHPRKNIELSIKVLYALHKKGLKAKLLLSGAYDPHEKKNVEYYYKLRRLIKKFDLDEYVIIVAEYKFKNGGKMTADRITIRDLYLISDLLFLPSTQEGFGLPIIEAGMIKLPVFCSDIPPFKNIGGNNVYYFNLNDPPDEIADKIIKVTSTLKTQRMYRYVINNLVWDNIYTKMLDPLLEKVISD
ncbi:MAG TPA: glycosyltransferase [Thermoplasmatales archaeon]|nr:glycosyltransferase [Thermoplasmatales archaeon]